MACELNMSIYWYFCRCVCVHVYLSVYMTLFVSHSVRSVCRYFCVCLSVCMYMFVSLSVRVSGCMISLLLPKPLTKCSPEFDTARSCFCLADNSIKVADIVGMRYFTKSTIALLANSNVRKHSVRKTTIGCM